MAGFPPPESIFVLLEFGGCFKLNFDQTGNAT